MVETALDRGSHLGHRHRTLLDRHHIDDRPEHHAVAEPPQRRQDGWSTTPGRPFPQRAENSLKGFWRV
jgi:hypothetical protein